MGVIYLGSAAGMAIQNKELTDGIDDTVRAVRDFEKTVFSNTPRLEAEWLEKEIQKDKLSDVARIIETTLRIGGEEKAEVYDEFLEMLLDSIDTVFYAQKNRKGIHFGKYRQLFKMFTEEVKFDVNKQKGRLLFQDGSIYFRTAPPEYKESLPNT
jgi:hypothetical protein